MNNTLKFDMAEMVARQAKAFTRQSDVDTDCYKHCVSTPLPEKPAVTMAYVPFQTDKAVYEPEMALREGTLFPALNKPFYGRSLCNE